MKIAVAIPAHDEAALIGRCLDSLARQREADDFTVVVLADNCRDATAEIARSARAMAVQVVERPAGSGPTGAGHARRAAMAAAAEVGEILLTTDADCVPDLDWIAAHRAAFAAGVDAVAGRVSGDWEELRHLPERAREIGVLEWDYLGLLAEGEAAFDPLPYDPAPRHAQCCGANLAITRAMLDRIGGVPAVATGEDRALIAAVERLDGRIRHDLRPHVTASARLTGRATGGMADALAARLAPDYQCDDQFQPAATMVALWQMRRAARARWQPCERHDTFGSAWGETQRGATAPPRLSPDALLGEIAELRRLIAAHG